MKCRKKEYKGRVIKAQSPVKSYRENPGFIRNALAAAAHYANRFQEDMIVIPGNSYGNAVYHIARVCEDLNKYRPGENKVPGYTVTVDRKIYKVELVV